MPFLISWLDERTMLVELTGQVSSEELLSLTAESFALVQAASQRIDAIVDQSQLESMPRNFSTLVKSIPRNRHPNQGMTIMIIPKMNQFGRFIGSTFLQILGLDYRIVQTMEEAQAILQKLRLIV